MKKLMLCALSLGMVGCASITNETTHPMKVETLTGDGQAVSGAECTFINDFATSTGKSGTTVQVRRSSKDLDIHCSAPGQADADARAISRANAGMAGNILFGGGIGAIIDHNKGTAYTYPTWIKLVFGEMRVFDRRDEKEGQPVAATTPAATSTAAAVQPKAAAPAPAVAMAPVPARPMPVAVPAAPAPVAVAPTAPAAPATPVPAAATAPARPLAAAPVSATPVAAAPLPAAARPGGTGVARLEDVDAVPLLNTFGRDKYREWLTRPLPRAFALSTNGFVYPAFGRKPAGSDLPDDASERALAGCERNAKQPCKLYAVNNEVVWGKAP